MRLFILRKPCNARASRIGRLDAALLVVGVVSLVAPAVASAQSAGGPANPPAVRIIDRNDIDVISRTGRRVGPVISTAGIAVDKGGFRAAQYDNFHIGIVRTETDGEYIRYGDRPIYPGVDGGHFGSQGYYTGDGELIVFDGNTSSDGMNRYLPISAMASSVVKADGEILTIYYQSVNQVFSPTPKGSGYDFHNVFIYQPRAVVSSLGWMAKYEYTVGGTSQVPTLNPVKTYIINTAVDYCDPYAATCTSGNAGLWPTFNFAACTDANNNPYICGTTVGGYTTPLGVKKEVNLFTSISLSNPATVKIGGKTWKYVYNWGDVISTSGTTYANSFQATTYNPDGTFKKFYSDGAYVATSTYNNTFTLASTVVVNGLPVSPENAADLYNIQAAGGTINAATKLTLDVYPRQPYMIVDELGRETKYEYYSNSSVANSDNRSIKRVIDPEATYNGTTLTGGYTQYGYDGRRNITSISVYPKNGGTSLVTQYEYEGSCTDVNYRYCNKPKKIIDPKGYVTEYTYAQEHGGLVLEKKLVGVGEVAPEIRYTYETRTPRVRNSGNVLVNSTPVWRLVKISSCSVAAAGTPPSCVGTDNERVTEYEYSLDQNLLLKSETIRAGNANVNQPYSSSNVWQRTSYEYDLVGNRISTDGPLIGDVDKTYTTYDIRRRPVYEIGADPDGTGPHRRFVIFHTYDADGNEKRTETGTTNTLTFTNGILDDFTPVSFVNKAYSPDTGLLIKTEAGTIEP